MAEAPKETNAAAKAWPRRPLFVGLVLALLGGAGGFLAVQQGLLFGHDSSDRSAGGDTEGGVLIRDMPDIAFVPIEPIVISLRDQNRHLRFRAQLEVPRGHQAEVERLMPRVVDVLNSYLRAVEATDLADGTSLSRLRAQMLRRVQIVTGGGRVNDLLIMEFVLN
jgi:flagellar FliL protein